MNIGEASSASGVSAKTIRYYEAARLIATANRSSGGYRVYTQADVFTLRFIKRARELGFSIERIRGLLDLWQDKGRASRDVKQLALDHIAEIRFKIAAMTSMRRGMPSRNSPMRATAMNARNVRSCATSRMLRTNHYRAARPATTIYETRAEGLVPNLGRKAGTRWI